MFKIPLQYNDAQAALQNYRFSYVLESGIMLLISAQFYEPGVTIPNCLSVSTHGKCRLPAWVVQCLHYFSRVCDDDDDDDDDNVSLNQEEETSAHPATTR